MCVCEYKLLNEPVHTIKRRCHALVPKSTVAPTTGLYPVYPPPTRRFVKQPNPCPSITGTRFHELHYAYHLKTKGQQTQVQTLKNRNVHYNHHIIESSISTSSSKLSMASLICWLAYEKLV